MEELMIPDLQRKMASGEATSVSLVNGYLERIEQIDRHGPKLNSVIELNPEAAQIAARLDDERKAGQARGPLHGVPLMVKDNIDTADRMQTTAGSLALEGHHAAGDAFIVEKLREAGAVILGKTNLSEWANFRSSHSSSGWSSRGGQTRNPYALDRSPCGSSSGSGAAVAAGLCAAAVGTETDGSVVCPSHICGIVGIKPTLGLLGRSGIIPIAHSQDTAGPMARTVTDAAILLGAMAGLDPRDPVTQAGFDGDVQRSFTDYTRFLDKDGLKGARIGVARGYFGFDARVDAIIEKAIGVMRAAGAEIVDPVKVPLEKILGKDEVTVLLYEFKDDLNAYLAEVEPGLPRSLAEIIAFNQAYKERVMPYFGQERMLAAQKKGGLNSPAYLKALEKSKRAAQEGIDAPLKEHRLDAIIAPTGSPAWLVDLVHGDLFPEGGFSGPTAVAGYPHITVPAGYVWGLPVGISFFGTAWQEPTLLRLAYAFEQATMVRKPPKFLKTVKFRSGEK